MKRQLLLSLAATLLALPVLARDFTYTYEGKTLTYTILDEEAKTCETKEGESIKKRGNYVSGDLIIPESVNDGTFDYKVIKIGKCSFVGCDLKSVDFPNSVTEIGDGAFYDCSLTSISIPKSITIIGANAFDDCVNLTKAEFASIEHLCKIEFGDGSANPLSFAKHLYIEGEEVIDIAIPNSITAIGNYTFYNCEYLKSIAIPNSVTEIGKGAFYGCKSLTSIDIPNTVTEIGEYAFYECYQLSSVILSDAITSIHQYTFAWCSRLTSIHLPDSLTYIDLYAFYLCRSLTSIVIPNSVTQIQDFAFYKCAALTSITLSSSLKHIGEKAFYNDFDFTARVEEVTSLSLTPPYCKNGLPFRRTTNCTLYVPDIAVDTYKSDANWGQITNIIGIAITKTINIDDLHYVINLSNHTAEVTYAEQNSLNNYEGLQSVIVPETVEYDGETYTVTGIGDEVFNNCWGLKAVSLPATLQTIGKLAFGYCTSLRSVVIPDEVTVIDNEAFTGCSALASVQIGSSVETIGDYAFFGCTGLSTLNVPESVKTIGENAFMGIHWINEVHAKSETPAEAPISAFSQNAYKGATLVVPDGSLIAYKAHPTWSNFMAIRENSDVPTKIEVVDGAIVVKGTETVRIYNTSGAQVYSGAAGRIELPAGIYLVATDSVSKKVRL